MISTTTFSQKDQMPVLLKGMPQAALLKYFQESWTLYEWLFSAIKEDKNYYLSPDPLRHPLIFYFGHTAAFYLNKMLMAGLISTGINPHFEELFAKGVDPNLPENLEKHNLWPTVEEVRAYRIQVKEVVENGIKNYSFPTDVDEQHPLWAVLMGIEHDRIHFETSSVLIRQLSAELLQKPRGWEYAPSLGSAPENKILSVIGGIATIGRKDNKATYGWDNEYGYLEKEVSPFQASQNLISNEEYLEFYHSGAYQNEQYWTAEGWKWKQRTQTEHPKFWVPTEKGFLYRAMFDVLPMPLDYPVEVNAHEAWAYCRWKGDGWRLLTEAEFCLLAQRELQERDCAFEECYNLHVKYGSPTPVGSLNTPGSTGFNDLFGNVWDWLSDDFYPLPDFEAHTFYKDFSAPYFDEEHSMLLGGAWATSGAGASRYYRLWFRRHFYQHAGFRIARSR